MYQLRKFHWQQQVLVCPYLWNNIHSKDFLMVSLWEVLVSFQQFHHSIICCFQEGKDCQTSMSWYVISLSLSLACSQGKLPSVIKLMNDYIFIFCSRTEMTNRWNANVTADMRICVLKFKECMVLGVIRTRRMDPIPHTNTSERKTFGVMRTKFTRPQSSHSHVCDCCSHPRTSQVEEYSRTWY